VAVVAVDEGIVAIEVDNVDDELIEGNRKLILRKVGQDSMGIC
jgi:hypothetical protein